MNTPECVWDAQAALGEGPLWSIREQALYWADILNHRQHRYSTRGTQRTWRLGEEISSVCERMEADGLIVTLRHGFAAFNPSTAALTFGGPNLKTLYITTAAAGLSSEQREREPLAGGLFAAEMDIAGIPANLFSG